MKVIIALEWEKKCQQNTEDAEIHVCLYFQISLENLQV